MHARTCVPCCPSRLQHVARDVSDARCSWSRRKDLSAHADSVFSPCTSRHWTVLYYTPLRPLRSSGKAETVATECYMVPQAHSSGQKTACGQLTCISFFDVPRRHNLGTQSCADTSQPCCQLFALRHPLNNLNSDCIVAPPVIDTSRSALEWWNCGGDGR